MNNCAEKQEPVLSSSSVTARNTSQTSAKYRLCGCISIAPSSSGLFMRVWLPQPVIKQLDIAYFEPSKSFGILSCTLFVTKLMWCQLDNWNIKWVEMWLVKGF